MGVGTDEGWGFVDRWMKEQGQKKTITAWEMMMRWVERGESPAAVCRNGRIVKRTGETPKRKKNSGGDRV